MSFFILAVLAAAAAIALLSARRPTAGPPARNKLIADNASAPAPEMAPRAAAPRPFSRAKLPDIVSFVDVETTGLTRDDRIVTLGAISVDLRTIGPSTVDLSVMHLVFNPERPCHKMAAAVHGYSDAELAEQELFRDRADEIVTFLRPAGLVVAHNASFDMRFINDALVRSGRPRVAAPTYCTMLGCRQRYPGEPAGLNEAASRIGAFRLPGKHHGALEDAWLAMLIFFSLHDLEFRPSYLNVPCHTPENWRGTPRAVAEALPRRRARARKSA